ERRTEPLIVPVPAAETRQRAVTSSETQWREEQRVYTGMVPETRQVQQQYKVAGPAWRTEQRQQTVLVPYTETQQRQETYTVLRSVPEVRQGQVVRCVPVTVPVGGPCTGIIPYRRRPTAP